MSDGALMSLLRQLARDSPRGAAQQQAGGPPRFESSARVSIVFGTWCCDSSGNVVSGMTAKEFALEAAQREGRHVFLRSGAAAPGSANVQCSTDWRTRFAPKRPSASATSSTDYAGWTKRRATPAARSILTGGVTVVLDSARAPDA